MLGILAKFAAPKLALWGVIATGACAASVALNVWQVSRSSYKSGAQDQVVQTCTDANAGEGLVIDDLRAKLTKCEGSAADIEAARNKADAVLDEARTLIQRVRRDADRQRQQAYDHDDACKASGAAPVCPAAVRMR